MSVLSMSEPVNAITHLAESVAAVAGIVLLIVFASLTAMRPIWICPDGLTKLKILTKHEKPS